VRRGNADGLHSGFGEHRPGIFESQRTVLAGERPRAATFGVTHGHQLRFRQPGQRAGVNLPHLAASDDGGSHPPHQFPSG